MAGIYFQTWSCNNCDYKDETISAPFRIKPKDGVYKALIEYRFCDECNGIRRCFTGKAKKYELNDVVFDYHTNKYIKLYSQWIYESRDRIDSRVEELELKKKSTIFFAFSKKAKELSLLKYFINQRDVLTEKADLYYKKVGARPRCLICGMNEVSELRWSEDNHSCGGEFIHTDLPRFGSVNDVNQIIYDEYGNPTHSIENIR